MTLFNYLANNDMLFYEMAIGVICHFGLFLLSYTWQETTDTGVQTDAW